MYDDVLLTPLLCSPAALYCKLKINTTKIWPHLCTLLFSAHTSAGWFSSYSHAIGSTSSWQRQGRGAPSAILLLKLATQTNNLENICLSPLQALSQ